MPKVLEASIPATHTTHPQSSAPRRIACDRCHGQKLKCPRDPNGSSPCTRCAKAGAVCQTSPARATGRPAKNPKQRPRKLESSEALSNSSRPSLTSASSGSTDSSNSTDDDLNMTGVGLAQVMSHATSSPDDFLATPAMHSIPMASDAFKYSSDMHYPYVVDGDFTNPIHFSYDESNNFMTFDPTMPPVTLDYPQHQLMGMGFYPDTEFGAMPQQSSTPLSIVDDLNDMKPMSEERRPSTSGIPPRSHSRNASIDSFHRPSAQSNYSSPLQHAHTISEEFPTTTLAFRTVSESENVSKKRRFSSLMSCTPQNELANLSHSQALSSIHKEVDTFSSSIMNSDPTVDVGAVIPIADKFMTLVSQICQQPSLPEQPRRKSSISSFKPPTLERSQTEPDPASLENAVADSTRLDSSLVQLIFACQKRLHFAFDTALNFIISLNVADPSNPTTYHLRASIGSQNLSTPLSTKIHLAVISDSLERLEATIRKYLSPDTSSATAIFDGFLYNHNQKRNEIASQAFRVQAFEEASSRKRDLMVKIRDIYAAVGEDPQT